jgi:hypothetical protein
MGMLLVVVTTMLGNTTILVPIILQVIMEETKLMLLLIVLQVTTEAAIPLRLTMPIHTITTMAIFITLIMTVRMEEHITGIHTGGMPITN